MDKTRILIVEDETIIAMFTREILMRRGVHQLQIVSTGEEALAIVREKAPHLILMDIILDGEIDGIQTARQIRQISDVPMIFLSAYTDPGTAERAREAGAAAFIEKPFRPAALYAIIDKLLANRDSAAG